MAAADYDFDLSRQKIIESALRKVGAFSEGEVMSAFKKASAVEALNVLVKGWQTDGVFLWAQGVDLVSTIANQSYMPVSSLSADNNIISIDRAFIRDDNTDTQLRIVSWSDYQKFQNKLDTGLPRNISHDRRNAKLYFYLTPDAIYNVYVFSTYKLKDFDADASGGDFEARWLRALIFALAVDLTFEYPVAANEKEILIQEAEKAFLKAKNTESRSATSIRRVTSNFSRRGFK